MPKNTKKCLYKIDLLGHPPDFRIFKEYSYKSTFSSVLSIIIFIISVAFFIYSLIDYLKYKNPSVIYSRDNDKSTNRTILIKDTLLLFALLENTYFTNVNKLDAYLVSELKIKYNNGSSLSIPLTLEICEYGKNFDSKYSESISSFGHPINDYYCFSSKDGDLPLFYEPDFGESSIYIYAFVTNQSKYSADELIIYIMNGNDIIEHNNKDNPIINNYFSYSYNSFSASKLTLINYYFQFIKYESDTGLIFPNSKIFNAKSFSHITAIQTKYLKQMEELQKGTIMIEISKINFDFYRRSYPRLQSFLAEVMTVINLIFGIGKTICHILLEKKMSKDIVTYLINKNNKIIIEDVNFKTNETNDKENYLEKKDINRESKDELNNSYMKEEKINTQSDIYQENGDLSNKKINADILSNLNYFHIFKSYFCFKDKKTKLINKCHELVTEDICIERILSRLYELEKLPKFLSENGYIKLNLSKNKKFEEINECISQIENSKINQT